jgi:hypothetical protein
MLYHRIRISRPLMIVTVALLAQTVLRAGQSNPKVESAYELPHANSTVAQSPQAEERETNIPPGPRPIPTLSEDKGQESEQTQHRPGEGGEVQ